MKPMTMKCLIRDQIQQKLRPDAMPMRQRTWTGESKQELGAAKCGSCFMQKSSEKSQRHSYYISLQDQKVAVSRLEGTPISSLRYKVSKKQTTRIYFATYHSQHGAAIQISISPFEIPAFPKQKFYNCCLRYTSCCEGASRTLVEAQSWKAAQRIYDFYFHPTEWDFSSEYSRRIDLPTPRSVLNETTCAEKLEAALTGYIQLAKKEDDDENDPGNLDTVKQMKRCRQYSNNFRNGNETSDDNETCADAARSFKRRRRGEGNYTGHADDNSHENDNCDADEHSHEDENDNCDADEHSHEDENDSCDADENSHEDENGHADENDNFDDNTDANRDSDADNNGDAKNVNLVLLHQRLNRSNHDKIREENDTSNDDEAAEGKYVTAISKKIRKGIEEVLRKKRNKNNHCSDVAVTGAELSTEIIPTDFEYAFLRGEFGVNDRLLSLQIVLWQKSSRVIRDARSISWKCSFIAACLSRIGNAELSDIENTAVSKSTRVRWAIAAWLINFIVDGLWLVWGPTAALVYEALASKNYNMSRLSKLGWPALHRIGRRIIESLAKEPTPLLSSDICVFHPAACVGTALNMNYKETCRVIGLEESFSKLDPPQDSQSHTPISSLLHQWIQYKSAFDTLVAVAVAEMGHDTDHPLGIEQPALDDSVSNSAYQLLTIEPNGGATSLHLWQGSQLDVVDFSGSGDGGAAPLHLWQGSELDVVDFSGSGGGGAPLSDVFEPTA
ncbi:hypothetical protein V502_00671 [Pseudogymnoascus sp. VKM F-4520 (FW-2644)]|nr:hypothetical protein V502_00671 [Pseudogymnoascus sp. VKM F-4520 (FW-2644)]